MQIAVVGAGRMGQGIAQVFATHGHDVRLIDQDPHLAAIGVDGAVSRIRREQKLGRLSMAHMDETIARLQPGDIAAIEADLVIEAVFEDLDVKRALFERLGKLPPSTMLASNTSSFRIRDLASVVEHPERVLGLHFFYPAHQNPLVEVVGTDDTAAEILERARGLMEGIHKTAITTRDSPGFAINRFLLPLANEACRLVDEGHDPGAIEASGAMAFGIPYGPFTVMDLSGPRVCWQAQSTLAAAFGAWYAPARAMTRKGEEGTPWGIRSGVPDHSLALRLRGAVFRAAQEMVDEGVASSADADTGARVGLMWPMGPFEMMSLPGVDAGQEIAATKRVG